MKTSIRSLDGDAMLDAFYPLGHYSFRPSPPFENKEEWLARVRGRRGLICRAMFEDETPVTIAASSAMTQNMRGKLYPASGVWGVATHPGARRKGYVRQVMTSLLAAERENGKVFTNLYPFRESFYERMGYVSFPMGKVAKFAPPALAPLLRMQLGGELELKLSTEVNEIYREYLAELRQQRHGMAFFDYPEQNQPNRNPLWAAFARFDGQIEGVMMYAISDPVERRFCFNAVRFYYQTVRARYLLLEWIARHIDQADRVEMELTADEYPETWLADFAVKVESSGSAGMSRVLDVAKIGGMEVGVPPAGGLPAPVFTAQIVDPLCPWNEGIWRFESCDGRLQVSKAASADCQLTIQGLTALIGGAHDPRDFIFRGWGGPAPAVQAVQRALFPPRLPYMHEGF